MFCMNILWLHCDSTGTCCLRSKQITGPSNAFLEMNIGFWSKFRSSPEYNTNRPSAGWVVFSLNSSRCGHTLMIPANSSFPEIFLNKNNEYNFYVLNFHHKYHMLNSTNLNYKSHFKIHYL